MLSFTWNSDFESLPTASLARSSIDDEIRRIKRGVSECMSREHEWGPLSEKNDGSHKGGSVQIALNGAQAERDALLNVSTGALFVRTDTSPIGIDYYNGATWEQAPSNLSHDNLTDRHTGNPHPQYMFPNGIYEVPLNANAFDLLVENGAGSNILLWDHVNKTTNPHGIITNPSVLAQGIVTYDMLSVSIISGTINLEVDGTDSVHRNIALQDAPHFVRSLTITNTVSDQVAAFLAPNTSSSWGIGFWIRNYSVNKEYHVDVNYSFYRINI